MIRILFVAFAAMLFLSATAPAQQLASLERARPVLKASATVTGSVVRIGDLIDNAGIVANVPIFRAPDLGNTGTVPVDAVLDAVRGHAIVGLDPGDISEITVTRASRAIAVSDIEDCLTKALSAQFSLGRASDIALNFDRTQRAIHVEPSLKGELRVARLYFDPRSRHFDATLDIPSSNGHRSAEVSGRAIQTVEIVTVVRPVARGEVLRSDDLVSERRPRAEIEDDRLVNMQKAAGFAARNELRPGRPLRLADLMKPEIIQRNETVTIVFEMPGIVLTVRGKATEGGAEGDAIMVLNEQSKRTVQGVIVGPGRVFVGNSSPRLAANIEAPAEQPKAEPQSNAQ